MISAVRYIDRVTDNLILITLLVKLGVVASVASVLARVSTFRRLFFAEHRRHAANAGVAGVFSGAAYAGRVGSHCWCPTFWPPIFHLKPSFCWACCWGRDGRCWEARCFQVRRSITTSTLRCLSMCCWGWARDCWDALLSRRRSGRLRRLSI